MKSQNVRNTEEPGDYKLPEWLLRLQENSWELELLISGGAIFSLFQFSDYFIQSAFALKMMTAILGYGALVSIGMLGIKLLTIGFSTHIILRAFWVGAVCLNYVFPKGSAGHSWQKKWPFSGGKGSTDNLKDQILQMDKYAGLAMFLSITFAGAILGFMFCILITITLPSRLLPNSISPTYFNIVTVFFSIYLLDLLLFGLFRKIRWVSVVAFPLFRILDIVTLRFTYGKALEIYSSNINKWKASLIFVAALSIASILTYQSLHRFLHLPYFFDERSAKMQMADQTTGYSYYRDEHNSSVVSATPSIQSAIIKYDFLYLKVPYERHLDFDQAELGAEKIVDVFQIRLNDSLILDPDWYNHFAPQTENIGVSLILDVSDLPHGKHILHIQNKADKASHRNYHIPFWKSVK